MFLFVATDDQIRSAKRINGMKVAVSRMLARANNLVDNAAVGSFPNVQPVKTPITWRPTQQERMNEAIEAQLLKKTYSIKFFNKLFINQIKN